MRYYSNEKNIYGTISEFSTEMLFMEDLSNFSKTRNIVLSDIFTVLSAISSYLAITAKSYSNSNSTLFEHPE